MVQLVRAEAGAIFSGGWARATQPSSIIFALRPAKPLGPIVYNWPDHRDRIVTTHCPQGILEVTYAHRIICR